MCKVTVKRQLINVKNLKKSNVQIKYTIYKCTIKCTGMKTSAPLISAVVNNVLFHSKSRINQILPQVIHILRFFLLDSLPHILK